MGNDDTRKITGDALLERRKQVIRLYRSGDCKSVAQIARAVGVVRDTAVKWIGLWESGGYSSLKPKTRGPSKGNCRNLTKEQEKDIRKSITDTCPDQLKLPFALWTRKAVKMLIMERFGLEMPIRTVGEYLKRWGFTPQKPIRRAYERNEVKIMEWHETVYPEIVKKARPGQQGPPFPLLGKSSLAEIVASREWKYFEIDFRSDRDWGEQKIRIPDIRLDAVKEGQTVWLGDIRVEKKIK